MKHSKDEEYYLLIPNPLTGDKEEFDLEQSSNAALTLRLIRKRANLRESSRKNFNRIKKLRKDHNIEDIEKSSQEVIEKISSLSKEDFDSDEEFGKEIDRLHQKLSSLGESFPQEIVDLQNKVAKQMQEMDRIGIKICTICLNPVNGIPEEYNSKIDYMEEIIADEQDVEDIINFFLSTLSSTTRSRKDLGIQMKKRSNGQTEKEEES